MKTTTLNFLKMGLYAIIGLSVLFTSCSPEDGKDGLDGMDGAQGPAGQDGNANVIASDWQTIQWSDDSIPNSASMLLEVNEVDVEEFIASGGTAMVYLKVTNDANQEIFGLPYIDPFNTYFSFSIFTNDLNSGIRFGASNVQNSVLAYQNSPQFTIRYVLVPANVVETTSLNLNNYNETSKLLGL
jgi:hypothetical protein